MRRKRRYVMSHEKDRTAKRRRHEKTIWIMRRIGWLREGAMSRTI